MRFIQRDTYLGKIKDPLSRHLYMYGKSNPLTYTDPSGRIAFKQIDDLIGGIKDGIVGEVTGLFDIRKVAYTLGVGLYKGDITINMLIEGGI